MSTFRNPEYEDAWLRGHGDGYHGESWDQGDEGANRQAYEHGKLEGARKYWRDQATGQ